MNKSFCCSGCELRLWERSSVSPTHFLITDANYLHHHLHTIMRQTLQRAEAVGFFFLSFIREWGDCHTGYAFANRQDGWSRLCPSPSSLGGWQLLALRSQHKRSLIYVYVCLSVNLSIYRDRSEALTMGITFLSKIHIFKLSKSKWRKRTYNALTYTHTHIHSHLCSPT